jgi:hypothetical protein
VVFDFTKTQEHGCGSPAVTECKPHRHRTVRRDALSLRVVSRDERFRRHVARRCGAGHPGVGHPASAGELEPQRVAGVGADRAAAGLRKQTIRKTVRVLAMILDHHGV